MVDLVSLAAGIAGIVSGTVKIATALHELRVSYRNVPASFKHLCDEYNIVSELLIAFRDVSEDLMVESAARGDNTQAAIRNFPINPEFILYTVQAAGATLSDLEKKVNSFASESNEESLSCDNSGSRIGVRKTLKYIWNESEINTFVAQLEAHKSSLNLALTIVSSYGDLTIRAALQNHDFTLADIAKNQRKMLLTMRNYQFGQARAASDDQESLFSLDSEYTRFAFDDELLLSKVYQNSPLQNYLNAKSERKHLPSPVLTQDVLVSAADFRGTSFSVNNLSSTSKKNSIKGIKTSTRDVNDQSKMLGIQSNRRQSTLDQSSKNDLLEIVFPPEATQRTLRASSQASHGLETADAAAQQPQSRESAPRLVQGREYNVKSRNSQLDEALCSVAINGDESTVRLLLEKGADVKAANKEGRTALHSAAKNGHEAVVRLLLERGADIKAGNKYGRTALHGAAWNGHEAVIRLLLERGADIKAIDEDRRTALHSAAKNRQEAVVRLLLERGADVNAVTKFRNSALNLATKNGHEAVIKLLLEKDANVKTVDRKGRTALHWAALKGHEAVVRLLLEKGADVKVVDKKGKSALGLTATNGHETVMRLLLEKTLGNQ